MVRPLKGASIFYNLVRRELCKRERARVEGVEFPVEYLRGLWYQYRTAFLAENPDRYEVDIVAKDPYRKFTSNGINRWFQIHADSMGFTKDRWFRARSSLNIESDPKAICVKKNEDPFLITGNTRDKALSNCSFVVTIEKKTFMERLYAEITKRGHEVNVIATTGYGDSDLQELQLVINEDQEDKEQPNFYNLFLHDLDLNGIQIFSTTLRKHYKATIDGGINGEFLRFLEANIPNFERRLIEERVVNKKAYRELGRYMKESNDYTEEDYNYLQGEPFETVVDGKTKTHWKAKRIELDSVLAVYGIEVFVDYLEWKIDRECKIWDLSRIGVRNFGLYEPTNHYEAAISQLRRDVGKAYGKKRHELSETYHKILEIVNDALTLESDFTELDEKHRGETSDTLYMTSHGQILYKYEIKTIEGEDNLKQEYDKQIKKEWKEDYQDRLDEVNDNITCYEGDVRKGKEDLDGQVDELQNELDEAKENDIDLEPFKEKLSEINWGEEELEAIEITPPAEEVRSVIEALQEYLEELEASQ